MAPVTLTKKQFLQRKPHGSYKKYLAYIGAHRPPPDPILEQAKAMVNASLDPIKAQYDAAAKARMADAMAASNAAKGFTAAFGRAQSAIPNTAGSAYQAAAQALSGYSGGLQGRAQDIADKAGADAAASVANLSGMNVPMPSATGALAVPRQLEEINAGTFVGRAPLVTNTLNALDTASRLRNADWADLQRYKGVQDAAAIREKFLTEASKRPALLQQQYYALKKDRREQIALQITQSELHLRDLAEQRQLAKSNAEIAAIDAQIANARDDNIRLNAQLALNQDIYDAKLSGGLYQYHPPKPTRPPKGSLGTNYRGTNPEETVANVIADLPARLVKTPSSAFNWAWQRIRNQVRGENKAKAKKILHSEIAKIAKQKAAQGGLTKEELAVLNKFATSED